MLFRNLLCHFVGNSCVWLYHGGKKSIDDVAQKDNSKIGFLVLIIVFLITLGFKK